MAACQGTILLVDAAQGIQAQTVANFYLAFSEGLNIIPILNKIDLPTAEPNRAIKQIESTFEIDTQDIIKVRYYESLIGFVNVYLVLFTECFCLCRYLLNLV